MNVSQLRLVGTGAITIAAISIWIWSYTYFPAGGFVRAALLFVVVGLIWSPFNAELKRVMLEQPLDQNFALKVFLCWLVVLLIVIFVVRSLGFEVPTNGAGAQISFLVFMAPVWLYFLTVVLCVYKRLGT